MAKFFATVALALMVPSFAAGAGLININTADGTLLDTLPGIGLVKAQAIVDYRELNGHFCASRIFKT